MIGIKNVRIDTISNGIIENGSILIKDGKILGLGDVDLSSCKNIIDGEGRIATPGIIDPHTYLGLEESGIGDAGSDTNEETNPVTPSCSVRDAINMKDQAFENLRRSGITTVGILPGGRNVIGGTGLALKCKGDIVDEAVVKDPIGMKVTLGENPKSNYRNKRGYPSTRMGSASILRGALLKAKEYLDKPRNPKLGNIHNRDDESEALLPVIKGEMPLVIRCHRHDDIATAIRICKEFNVGCRLNYVTDGHLVKDIIKRENIHCGVESMLYYGSQVENKDRNFRTPIIFDREKIPFCFITDHPIIDGRNLILAASIATQWGMSDENALKSITLDAAKHMGIEGRVGSLELGKDADIVIWSGNPLEFTTFVDMTIVDGEIVYEREGR